MYHYTFHKDVAINFSLRNHLFGYLILDIFKLAEIHRSKGHGNIIKNYLEDINVDEFLNNKTLRDKMYEEHLFIKKIKASLKKNSTSKKELAETFDQFQQERTGYVGTYEIKINDILFVSNRGLEMECVSNNYKLLNYQVVDVKTMNKWWNSWGRRILGNDYIGLL